MSLILVLFCLSNLYSQNSNPVDDFKRFASIGDLDNLQKIRSQIDNVDDMGSGDDTALMLASRGGHIDVMTYLLDEKASFSLTDKISGFTALHFAVLKGHMDAVQLLLARGADPEASSNDGRSALSIAKEKGFLDIIPLLESNYHTNENPSTNLINDLFTKYFDVILSDPNVITSKVSKYPQIETNLREINKKGLSEQNAWKPSRRSMTRLRLATGLKRQLYSECELIQKYACLEDPNITSKKIETIMKDWDILLKEVLLKLREQRREEMMQGNMETFSNPQTNNRRNRSRHSNNNATSTQETYIPNRDVSQEDLDLEQKIMPWINESDNKEDFCLDIHNQIFSDLISIRSYALSNKAEKTVIVTEGLILNRYERLKSILNAYAKFREMENTDNRSIDTYNNNSSRTGRYRRRQR